MSKQTKMFSRRGRIDTTMVRQLERERRFAAARRARGEHSTSPSRTSVSVRRNDGLMRFLELTRRG